MPTKQMVMKEKIPTLRCGDGNILHEIQRYDKVMLSRKSLHALYNTIEMMNHYEKRSLDLHITSCGVSIKGKKIEVYDEASMDPNIMTHNHTSIPTSGSKEVKELWQKARDAHREQDNQLATGKGSHAQYLQDELQKRAEAKLEKVTPKYDIRLLLV